jgi:NAD(P)-dependent dehydrogenase (short-subunit alcohol dehydrogenase family)
LFWAARGIWAAPFYADHGARLIIHGRSRSKLEELAEELRTKHGATVATVAADVASESERLADEAWSAFGVVDVVLSNAVPALHPRGDILTAPDAVWTEDYEVIVLGPMRVMRRLAPRMRDAGGGSFVGITSATAHMATPGYDSYALAKGSLMLLTKYMSKEWGPWNIRSNCLCPGGIVMVGEDEEEMLERVKRAGAFQKISLARLGHNEEVTGPAVFLASDESSYISGQCLNVEGGRV